MIDVHGSTYNLSSSRSVVQPMILPHHLLFNVRFVIKFHDWWWFNRWFVATGAILVEPEDTWWSRLTIKTSEFSKSSQFDGRVSNPVFFLPHKATTFRWQQPPRGMLKASLWTRMMWTPTVWLNQDALDTSRKVTWNDIAWNEIISVCIYYTYLVY